MLHLSHFNTGNAGREISTWAFNGICRFVASAELESY